MKFELIADELGLVNLTPELESVSGLDIELGHASDLLSDVLANAPSGGLLVTNQLHLNVIAVSVHAQLSVVIFSSGRRPKETVRHQAAAENVALYSTGLSTFDVVGRLYALGVRGNGERVSTF